MGGLSGDSDDTDQVNQLSAGRCLEEAKWLGRRQRAPEDRVMQLTRTIESEIIPRLLLSSRSAGQAADARIGTEPRREQVEELAGLIINHDMSAALAYVTTLRSRGVGLETIFLHLLAPAAQHLGDLWEADLRNFADVTIGLSRLQQLLRALSPEFESELAVAELGHRALLVPARGEEHTFGLFMLEEFFRRSGWDVWGGASADLAEISSIVSRERIDVVGFSLSTSAGLDDLSSDIKVVRRLSLNPSICVMVGGPAFVDNPERVKYVGADGTASDGQRAVATALNFVVKQTKRLR